MAKSNYFYALGRRKTATAQVRIGGGKGAIVVNGKPALDYFDGSKFIQSKLQEPFVVLELDSHKYDITARVKGGGQDGQVEAIRLGISKALSLLNEDYRGTLKRAELLRRDPRDKERKKFGLLGARKQRQFTKR
ncbi:MAG: 30S ribosomal protein S9 [Candidatus Saccharimonadales bacterium]